jgi:hypothetical protein
MKEETFDISIKLGNKPATLVNGLTGKQIGELKAIFDAATVVGEKAWYLVANHLPTEPAKRDRAGFLSRLMHRFNAWAMGGCVIIALMLGAQEAFAQGLGARAVEPVRVSFADDSTATAADREFNELLRLALNERATVRFTSSRFDFRILTATAPITSKGQLQGFAVAVGVLAPGIETKELSLKLHITIGPTLDALAGDVGAFLDKELQRSRRRR